MSQLRTQTACTSFILLLLSFICTNNSVAEESAHESWPCYGADAARTAQTTNALNLPLSAAWTYTPAQAPEPAWDAHEVVGIKNRVNFDMGVQPVIAHGMIYLVSCVDDSLRALSLKNGTTRWTFTANAPLRFAPHVVGSHIYIASDDGFVYCLDAASGSLVWQFQAAINDEMVLGNERMISRWPMRSGVLVENGVVYCTAGMWPAEGILVYALDAQTGKEIWCNDSSGALLMRGKHLGAWDFSGISPQGYLAASKDVLIVTTGRGTPYQFDKHTGKLLNPNHPSLIDPRSEQYYSIHGYNNMPLSGGVWVTVVEGKNVFVGNGHAGSGFGHYLLEGNGMPQKAMLKSTPWPLHVRHGSRAIFTEDKFYSCSGLAIALCDQTLITSSEQKVYVRRLDVNDPKELVELAEGDSVFGFAVADGYLVVGTAQGRLLCFADSRHQAKQTALNIHAHDAQAAFKQQHNAQDQQIIKTLEAHAISKGYALLMNEDAIHLACRLAEHSDMQIVMLQTDLSQVHDFRRQLMKQTTWYGSRIAVHYHDEKKPLPYPAYFANLLVCDSLSKIPATEIYKCLRPCGGLLFAKGDLAIAKIMAAELNIADSVQENQGMLTYVHGKIPGAFDWDTQLNEASTSTVKWKSIKDKDALIDQQVNWPLEMLWYGGPGPGRMNNRHWQPSTPLPANGRYFVVGRDHVIAVDAYNGTTLWEQAVKDAATQTVVDTEEGKEKSAPSLVKSLHANDDSLFINLEKNCIELDAQTGAKKAVYGEAVASETLSLKEPQQFSLVVDEAHQGIITLSYNDKGLEIRLQSIDPVLTWHDSWELFFDFRPLSERFGLYGDKTCQAIVYTHDKTYYKRDRPLAVRFGAGTLRPAFTMTHEKTDTGMHISLQLSAEELRKIIGSDPSSFGFTAIYNATDTSKRLTGRGDDTIKRVYLPQAYGAPALNAGWTNIFFDKVTDADQNILQNQRKTVRDIKTLSPEIRKWSQRPAEDRLPYYAGVGQAVGKRTHPITGLESNKVFTKSYGCRREPVASESMLFFRSSSLGFYDYVEDAGLRNIGGIRPGCKGGLLPALGLFIANESSSGCSCSYSFQSSMGLGPARRTLHEDWALFYDEFPNQALKHMSLNFGAPGDKRDLSNAEKTLWLAQPRPRIHPEDPHPQYYGKLCLEVPVSSIPHKQFGPDRQNADRIAIKNTEKPWVYTSYERGFQQAIIDLHPLKPWTSLKVEAAPNIDGDLEDAAWKCRPLLHTENSTPVYMRHDEEFIYIAFKQLAAYNDEARLRQWGETVNEKDGDIWKGKSFELYLTKDIGWYDPRYAPKKDDKVLVHIGVSASGARFDSLWVHKRYQKEHGPEDRSWDGDWQSAVKEVDGILQGELAIRKQSLIDQGLAVDDSLMMVAGRHLGDFHGYHRNWNFRHLAFDDRQHPESQYTVRLHFAEPDDVNIGQRRFNILIQDTLVEKDVDIFKHVGRNAALIKEYKHIPASSNMRIALQGLTGDQSKESTTIISGLEVFLEEPNGALLDKVIEAQSAIKTAKGLLDYQVTYTKDKEREPTKYKVKLQVAVPNKYNVLMQQDDLKESFVSNGKFEWHVEEIGGERFPSKKDLKDGKGKFSAILTDYIPLRREQLEQRFHLSAKAVDPESKIEGATTVIELKPIGADQKDHVKYSKMYLDDQFHLRCIQSLDTNGNLYDIKINKMTYNTEIPEENFSYSAED